MALRVNLAHLVDSAMSVTTTGEKVATEHTSSDARISAAHAGWVGSSADALAARMERWSATSGTLVRRLSDHAQGMHDAAHAYAANEDARVEDMGAVAQAGDRAR